MPGDTSGALDNDSGPSMSLFWWLVSGSNRNSGSLPTTWEATVTADEAAGLTANIAASTSSEFYLTGLQFEVGEKATPFEHRSFGDELTRCQRYFQTSFSSNPSTTNADNAGLVLVGGSTTGNTTTFLGAAHVQLAPSMRAAPTVTTFDLASPRNTNTVHRHTYGSAGSNNNTATITDVNTKAFIVRSDSGSSGSGIIFHYTVESEL